MKIAIVSAVVSNKSGARAPVDLASHLAKRRHQVTFFAFSRPFEQEANLYLKESGVSVVTLGASSLLGRWVSAYKLLILLRRGKFDVVSTHGTFPFALASFLSRKPVVKTYYGLQFFSWNALSWREKLVARLLDKIILWREKFSFLLARQTVAISRYLAREAEQMLRQSVSFVYLGVNPPQSGKPSPSLRKLVSSGSPLVLSVSRIVPYKGFDTLIKVLQQIDLPWRLVIVGSYGKEEYFSKIKALAGKRVVFLRGIPDRDLAFLYQKCDFYALGGKVWEGLGLPFLEAGLFGKPSVAFRHSALPEVVIHRQTGFLAEDERQFKEYLARLLQDKRLRKRMGERAKEHARQFSWDNCAREYEKIFQKYSNL